MLKGRRERVAVDHEFQQVGQVRGLKAFLQTFRHQGNLLALQPLQVASEDRRLPAEGLADGQARVGFVGEDANDRLAGAGFGKVCNIIGRDPRDWDRECWSAPSPCRRFGR